MANRSYLYSTDTIPDGKHKITAVGLSEWSWDIPVSHYLLVSGDTQMCPSAILGGEEGKLALIGDYDKGVTNLKKFFDLFKEGEIKAPEVFGRAMRESFEYLERNDIKKKYVLLEPFEIFDMDKGITEERNGLLLKEINYLDKCLQNDDFDRINHFFTNGDLRKEWEEDLGLDNWIDALWIDLSNQKSTNR